MNPLKSFLALMALFLTRKKAVAAAEKRKPLEQVTIPAGGVYVRPAGKKIRRNGPCPCGSMTKFKRCHLPAIRAGLVRPIFMWYIAK